MLLSFVMVHINTTSGRTNSGSQEKVAKLGGESRCSVLYGDFNTCE